MASLRKRHGEFLGQRHPGESGASELKPDEMLCKVGAVGLCFSDVKIIRAGGSLPKLSESDLNTHTLIIGHEAVLTIVNTGKDVPKTYGNGQRYLIQPDIYINGRCFDGYGMDGGLAQYSIIDHRVWKGTEESYLLPCPENLSSAGAALLELWTCVRAAYHIPLRTAPKEDGGAPHRCRKRQ